MESPRRSIPGSPSDRKVGMIENSNSKISTSRNNYDTTHINDIYAGSSYNDYDDVGEDKNIQSRNIEIMDRLDGDEIRKLSYFQSLMNFIKVCIGTGVFALPIAFKFGGVWVSFVSIAFIGLVSTHAMHLLVKSSRFVSQKANRSGMNYGEVVEEVCLLSPSPIRNISKHLKIFTYVFLTLTQFGFCASYIVFVAYNVQVVVEEYSPSIQWSTLIYQSIIALSLIPFLCITHLKTLSFVSLISNILIVLGLGVVLYSCFVDMPPILSRPAYGSWKDFPRFFSIAIFTFDGIALISPTEKHIKNPKSLDGVFGVINIGMIVVTATYLVIGFFGFLKYGEAVKSSITLNLPNTIFYNVVRLLFALSIFISYAVQFYIPINFIWSILQPKLIDNAFFHKFGEYFLKMFFHVLTFAFVAAVPHLELVIALIGALFNTPVALTLPAFLDIILCNFFRSYESLPPNGHPLWLKLKIFKNFLIVLIATAGTVVGTLVTVIRIVRISMR